MQVIGPENKKLAIIDVHLAWCGNCMVMEQNFRTLYFSFDNADSRLQFWTCSEENIPPEYIKGFKYGELTCKPRFLVYLESEKKDEILGADYCKIEQNCQKWTPALDD